MTEPLKTCYLNGDFKDIDSATIPVLDRGFIFGDAVYEVIPVIDGIAFLLEEHLQRLSQSLAAISIELSHEISDLKEILYQLIDHNGGGRQTVYLQISRGVAPRDHAVPKKLPPTVFMYSAALGEPNSSGISAISLTDNRWARCDIKSTSLLGNVLLRTQAVELGTQEAILFRDGVLTEGAASNIFVVLDGEIITPPCSDFILPGITRKVLIEILADSEIPVSEKTIDKQQFQRISEAWLTSSSKDLVPITYCDEQPIGDGNIGAVFMAALRHFQRYKLSWLEGERNARGRFNSTR